ncbi:hypothetical protein [Paraburkholderia humisilvae]|uniref:Uncharacterized protein n=1 Tax=Paraburkholderia humisilvae TaxID=627669 RepID=A0A6J5ER69_9BURK|nr:hypothetical protein [Paraburkholderia humisilvae]CAB3767505.1 hypothetical protein LMG29542_05625 [Paraburkholderia humisilvae]
MSYLIDRLTIHTRAEEERFVCTWRLGRKQGIVYVMVETDIAEKDVVAELSALHYLVEEVQLMGDNRSGTSLEITISNPTIAALQSGRSKKSHLYPFAVLLRTKFAEVPLKVEKDCGWVGEGASTRVRHLSVSEPLKLVLDVKGHGRVGVRQHGFDQFRARLNHVNVTDAWKEMQRVAKAGMWPIPNPERGSTRLYHADSHWVFVVGDDGYLITAYTEFNVEKHAQQAGDRPEFQ